ncbi:hypothetical protein G7Y89_g12028 [Cudoniella acicularis]|uniref:PEBP-like protein n=1 Tax=Cudoniella acicularis TaxID=354080 RepID=A0A8H4RC09_9HELO|nr:hypothetical protein G7Y89_g12028 [Cudoniella acicularis]
MHFPNTTTTVLSTFVALGQSVTTRKDTATSISVADFKSSLTASEIVPDVLAAFSPTIGFYVGFNSDAGGQALLQPGGNLSLTEAKAPAELSVEIPANAPNISSSTRFLIYMIGPDVPSRSNPTSRNVRHFLAGNFTMSGKSSSLLSTAITLTNSSAATNEYAAPTPAANTGSHRYVWLVYVQPPSLNTKSIASLGFNVSNRIGFNLTSFRLLTGDGAAIGGNSFVINTDTNITSTSTSTSTSSSSSNSGSSNSSTSGTSTGSSTSSGISSTATTQQGSGAMRLGSDIPLISVGLGLFLAALFTYLVGLV